MKKTIFTICMLLCMLGSLAQTHFLDKANSQLSIKGTSNVHDWGSVVEKFKASATLEGDSFTGITFEATVKSIKSGKSGMDKNIYSALAADKHSKITFTADKLSKSGTKLTGKGKLTINGKTNEIPVSLDLQEKDGYIISGHIEVKMSDYGVEPPTAVFGTIKTGDVVSLDMVFKINAK